MKKTNSFKGRRNINTSFHFGEFNIKKRASTSSSFPALLKWFKKDYECNTTNKHNGLHPSLTSTYSNNKDEIFPTTSPVLDHLSLSSSCDSVLSTSTTGFAFIEPQNYEIYRCIQKPRSLSSDKLENHKKVLSNYNWNGNFQNKPDVTVRARYLLYGLEDSGKYDNIYYFDNSLPNGQSKISLQENCNSAIDPHKNCYRSASDNSKDKKSGAYVHVKGKRRAPPPPTLENKIHLKKTELSQQNTNEGVSENYDLLSPSSTLGMKKRKAPLPPFPKEFNNNNSILRGNLQNDEEIGCMMKKTDYNQNKCEMSAEKSKNSKEFGVFPNKQLLTEETVHSTEAKHDINKLFNPLLPASIKSWYEHSPSTDKNETTLKTKKLEKCKVKENECTAGDLSPEVGYSRSSLYTTGCRISSFFKHKPNLVINKIKEKDKYHSSIGMPNISELDREAALIVSREYENNNCESTNQTEGTLSECVKNNSYIINENTQEKILNKKEVLKQDENSINTFCNEISEQMNTFIDKGINEKADNFTDNEKYKERLAELDAKLENLKYEREWSCPFCTLKNPSWKILCNACERLKPYEPNKICDIKTEIDKKDPKSNKTERDALESHLSNKIEPEIIKKFDKGGLILNSSTDWEEKTEKVKQYFGSNDTKTSLKTSKTSQNNKLLSSSFNIGQNQLDAEKIYQEQIMNNTNQSENNKLKCEEKQLLLDSSVIVTTVTPVFYATQVTQIEKPSGTIEQNNSTDGKLEKDSKTFTKLPQKVENMSSTTLEERIIPNDPESLEREKRRLREKIRAMNAKVLTEKYPVMEKHTSFKDGKVDENIVSNEILQKKNKSGATKKVFSNKYSLDPTENHDVHLYTEPSQSTKESHAPLVPPKLFKSEKPEKISTSVQTSGFLKTYSTNSDNAYSNVLMLSGNKKHDFYNKDLNELNRFSTGENIEPKLHLAEGIIDFTLSQRNPTIEISRTDTLALSKIIRNLEQAIEEGQDELAGKLAIDLAKMKVSLQVTKVKTRLDEFTKQNQEILVDFYIEDKVSKKGPIQILVTPLLTILELKQKIQKNFEIPIEFQKWFINNELASKHEKTLLEYGLIDSTSKLHLHLTWPADKKVEEKKINISNHKIPVAIPKKNDDTGHFNDNMDLDGATSLSLSLEIDNKVDKENNTWTCLLCTTHNPKERTSCIVCTTLKPIMKENVNEEGGNLFLPHELQKLLFGTETKADKNSELKNDLNKITLNKKTSEMLNIIKNEPNEIKFTNTNNLIESSSPNITKTKYRGVYNYNVNRVLNNKAILTDDLPLKKEENRAREPPKIIKQTNHYLELMKLDCSDAVPNSNEFECPICFVMYKPGEGVILRDCLHVFCKECLCNTIKYNEEAEVKCPYMDAIYSCNSTLQEREIKSIVNEEIYEQHLAKSVRVAEHHIANTFHCKTPNCRGWCIYEDNVNEFKCPVCCITNCLTCRVIHDGLTCKQYQDRLDLDSDSNMEARRTKCMIEEMVEKGEAMKCPTCQIIMMKKWGCDWLKCSMCKTEVCWVTRGPRWGPGGKGDTSGGCKCGIDGKKCHPKCNYCH